MKCELGGKRFSFCVMLLICCLNINSCCRKETPCYFEWNVHEQIKYERLIQ